MSILLMSVLMIITLSGRPEQDADAGGREGSSESGVEPAPTNNK